MQSIRLLLVILMLPSSILVHSQINRLKQLKEKAQSINVEKVKALASDAIDDERDKIDSTSFSYAISINDNADFFEADSKRDQAVKLMSNLKNRQNQDELEKARGMLDVGEVLYAKGHYKKAAVTFLGAKLKYEDLDKTNDANYFKIISNIGLLYATMGRYTQAEEYTLEALNKRTAAFGKDHSSVGASLNNLAVLQKETGRYNEAEIKTKEAIGILKNSFGEQSIPVAIALNNGAMLYQAIGRYDEAEKVMNNVIAISSSIQNEKSVNHQKFLTNQALLFQEMGKYEQAESMFKELIQLRQRFMGTNHPDYAHMLSNLAALYVEMEKYDQVEDLLKEAIRIYRDNFGAEHSQFASAISYLGNFYRHQQRYSEAKPLLIKASEIRSHVLGENHPEYAQSKEDLAILYWKIGEYNQAEVLYKEALSKSFSFINSYFPPMSEAEKTKYWDKLRPRFERFYGFVAEAYKSNPGLLGDLYDSHIGTKGLLLNSTSKIKDKILNSGDQELINKYLAWLDQKEMLARYYSYSQEELEDREVNLDSLESAANANEKQLSQQSDLFNEGYSLKSVSYQSVAAMLKPDEIVLEIIKVRKFSNNLTDDSSYIILALTSNSQLPEIQIIDNGTQLEERYFRYYYNAIHQKIVDEYSYDQFWTGIAPLVGNKKHIYLSVDGIYTQINLNTLRNASGKYIIDDFDLTLIGNSKELVEDKSTSNKSNKAYLIGNPDFGGELIKTLPGTKKEIENISKILTSKSVKAVTLTNSEATEQNLKAVDNPRILHIATHGYFLKDSQMKKGKVFGISSESARDNPLLRSGLMLTGAGDVLDQDKNSASMESSNNGILTAYEAMNLSIEGTDLVVMSACETGVGDVKAGEGVYGLQRSFLAAGANSMIMSLWKVDDTATQELMTKFYTDWLNGKTIKDAFRQAQLATKLKYPDPYYWGAFILISE